MRDFSDLHPSPALTRRRLLRCSAAALATVAVAPAFARMAEQRTLTFVHTHTGEKLVTSYKVGGCYQPGCLAQVNHLLRDFRTGETHPIDPPLLDLLFDLQVLADREATFEVICGYRSPVTNAQLHRKSSGVASHSLHMQGKAIDIRISGLPTARLRDYALSLRRGGVGYYAVSDFVHVDTGWVRFW